MNACQIKKYFLICAQCTMARGVGYTEIVEKERDRERKREREKEGYCFVHTLNSGRRIHLLWYEWLSHIWDKLVFSLPCCYSRAARSLELFYDF